MSWTGPNPNPNPNPDLFTLRIANSRVEIWTWFLGPTRINFANDITTGSDDFAGLVIVTD